MGLGDVIMNSFLNLYIYIFVPTVILISFLPIIKNVKNNLPSILLVMMNLFFISIILVFRDIDAPQDIRSYYSFYNNLDDFTDIFLMPTGDIFFAFLLYIGNTIGMDKKVFFILLSLLYLLITYKGYKLIFHEYKYVLLALCFFTLSSTFILLYTNVLRQGLALSMLILSIGFFVNKSSIKDTIILLLSIVSHFSMIFFIPIIVIAKFVSNRDYKKLYIFSFIFIFILFLPILGSEILGFFSQFGGSFRKIESYGNVDYNNKLVYIKVFIMYVFLLIFYDFGSRLNNFMNYGYKLIFNIYLLSLNLIFLILPVLLLSSRLVYYASGLMPILFVYMFYSKNNYFKLKQRYFIFASLSIGYGVFVYNYQSIQMQLFQ